MVQQGHYGELSNILGAIPVHQRLATHDAPVPEAVPEEQGEEEAGQPAELAAADAAPASDDDEAEEQEATEEEGDSEKEQEEQEEQEEEEQAKQQGPQAQQAQHLHRLQTFVFSATLTLPANLRKRLRKGGGGASGSSDLDGLMDQIPFRCRQSMTSLVS
jgi:ATP-dependent RNA helicase DDX24/MAK5